MISTLLLILALAVFLFAMVNFPTRINLVALGLALWVLSILLNGVHLPR